MLKQRIPRAKFSPGQVSVSNDCMQALHDAGDKIVPYLLRHCQGDWGDVCSEDRRVNEDALRRGLRLLSVYTLSNGKRILVLTDGNRLSTVFLMRHEY